jgi:hypothetical protein
MSTRILRTENSIPNLSMWLVFRIGGLPVERVVCLAITDTSINADDDMVDAGEYQAPKGTLLSNREDENIRFCILNSNRSRLDKACLTSEEGMHCGW